MQLLGHREFFFFMLIKQNRNRTKMEKQVFSLCHIFRIGICEKYTSRDDKNFRTESAGKFISRWVFFGRKVNMENIPLLYRLFTPKCGR
jgi:hypothetical protein